MKTTIRLSGHLLSPLMKGESVTIAYGGNLIRTSRVMKIMENNEYEACFETAGAIFRVSHLPITMEAALSAFIPCAA